MALNLRNCVEYLIIGLAGFLVCPSSAAAQTTPSFEFAKPEPVVKAWTLQVKSGLIIANGNAQAINGVFGGNSTYAMESNKVSVDVVAAYGRANNRVYNPAAAGDVTVVDSNADISREQVTSTNNALGKARYDRFLSESSAGYALGSLGRDPIAGKDLFGGGQVGYSYRVFKNQQHQVMSELGYDFSYESYVENKIADVSIHSARLFVGEVWKISESTGLYANAETLLNLNRETNALDASSVTPKLGVDALKDIRVNGRLGLSTTLWGNVSFGAGVIVKYDHNPAPLAPTSDFGKNFRAFSSKTDVATDLSLIVTFL